MLKLILYLFLLCRLLIKLKIGIQRSYCWFIFRFKCRYVLKCKNVDREMPNLSSFHLFFLVLKVQSCRFDFTFFIFLLYKKQKNIYWPVASKTSLQRLFFRLIIDQGCCVLSLKIWLVWHCMAMIVLLKYRMVIRFWILSPFLVAPQKKIL